MTHYHDKEYWDKRYERNPHPFEWYLNYKDLQHTLQSHVNPNTRLLYLGCGNSTLGEDLYDNLGVADVTCVDISPVAIKVMNERRRNRVGLNYVAMDMGALEFPTGTFDCVIDKATLDTIYCMPEEEKYLKVLNNCLTEIYRVLAVGGQLIWVTHGSDGRSDLLNKHGWSIEHKVMSTTPMFLLADEDMDENLRKYHLYICTKKDTMSG
eukprot:TRINITY_DN60758_c1_g1_i1.p1 TRINITY_DN60758_c1_g1~~TRINITY_DN60758_c1_g1_i1.p1  ORF type:complete len:209 (+),score=10.78 TRINITY_DN60758_c1_g1_i1:87-713(+)